MKANIRLHTNGKEKNELVPTDVFHAIPGIWIGGKTYWLQSEMEELNLDEGILLHIKRGRVQPNIWMCVVTMTNQSFCPLHVKLIFQYRQKAYKEDCSFISPTKNIIYSLSDDTIQLIGGQSTSGAKLTCSVQPLWNNPENEIWARAESGVLKYNPMANGNTISLQIIDLEIEENETCEGKSWLINGQCERELLKINEMLLKTH